MTYFGVCPSMRAFFSSGADLEGTYAPPPRFYSSGTYAPYAPVLDTPLTVQYKLHKVDENISGETKCKKNLICQFLFFPYCNSYFELFTIAPHTVIALYRFANSIVLLPKCLLFFKL